MVVSNYEIIIRLIAAVACGAVIGLEREKKNQAAGLRTHIVVILGATLVMIVSKYGFTDIDINTKDPARLAAQVVSGIGFLGAGMIIVNRNRIRGLTTAASLWTTACVGLAIGAGCYVPAIATAVLLFATLTLLQRYEVLRAKKKTRVFIFDVENTDKFMDKFEDILARHNIIMQKIEILTDQPHEDDKTDDADVRRMAAYLQFPEHADTSIMLHDVKRIQGLRRVEEKKH